MDISGTNGITTTSARAYDQVVRLLRSEEMDFLQVDYAIDNREVEERILPLAADQGVAVLTALPFGRGRVFQVFGDQPIPGWAAELGMTSWAQFALKYNERLSLSRNLRDPRNGDPGLPTG